MQMNNIGTVTGSLGPNGDVQPPKRKPRGAAGNTEAAARGGRRSAEIQIRGLDGRFMGKRGGNSGTQAK